MKNLMIKTWKPLLSLLFGVAVVIFWAVPFVGGLCFQEQYQMFLFDTGYFLERIVLPGGLADYISEFLVQFYYMPVLGGAIIALLLMGIQTAVWGLMKQYGARHDFPGYLLSFLPSIALWCAMGDQNVLLSFVVALFGALVIGWIHNRFHNRLVKVVFELVSTALVYWLLGPVVFLYAVLMIGDTLKNAKQKGNVFSGIGYSAVILILTVAWILLTTQTLQYPLYRIFAGLNYYRYPGAISTSGRLRYCVLSPNFSHPMAFWMKAALVTSEGGNQKLTSGRAGFSLLADFVFICFCHSTSLSSSFSSCSRKL
jgi:hypothetical protein